MSYGGETTFIAEHTPDRRCGFMGSWLEFGTLGGFILGASTYTLLVGVLTQNSYSVGAGAFRSCAPARWESSGSTCGSSLMRPRLPGAQKAARRPTG